MNKPLPTETTAALNRVLLQAATRAERVNTEREAEKLASEVAKLCDEYARAG
jgi:hypothetical protein